MRAVVIDHGCAASVLEIPDGLEAMQALVGGYLEHVPYRPGLTIYVDEDGISKGLPPNRTVGPHLLRGRIVVVAIDGEGADVSLDDDQVNTVLRDFS